ncbi:hypothetical protein LP419_27205 [Massilia sp. H-1]|nr:hypothetical protein LP419_27205 [Massilia sp. H-1]
MAYRWETAASVWLEDESSAQFELASSEGLSRIEWQAQARGRLPDVARLLGASLLGRLPVRGHLPRGLRFLPDLRPCAAQTRGPPAERAGLVWPLVRPGLAAPRAARLAGHLAGAGRQPGRAPGAAPCGPLRSVHAGAAQRAVRVCHCRRFGFPVQRLLALAHTRNVLQYWDPLAELWHVMSPEDHGADLSFTASAYAWLLRRSIRAAAKWR